MSSPTPGSVKTELDQAVSTASATLVSSLSALEDGTTPFSLVTISGVPTTSSSALSVTGTSSLSANEIFHLTLVSAAGVTTFTYSGFIRMSAVDSGGNITDGSYYIPFGLVS